MAFQYTDIPLTFKVKNLDLSTITQPHITFEQGIISLDITDVTLTDNKLAIILTQEQTAKFRTGPIEVQINFINSNGLHRATKRKVIDMEKNLLRKVIPNG